MLSALLLLTATALNMFRGIGYRVLVCFVVIMSTALHTFFFDAAVSFSYYGTAAIANLCVILFLSTFSTSPLSSFIQALSLAAIVVNFAGFIMYESGMTPFYYNSAMLILMLTEFIRLIVRTPNDRIHDACQDFRMHYDFSVNDNISSSSDAGKSK